ELVAERGAGPRHAQPGVHGQAPQRRGGDVVDVLVDDVPERDPVDEVPAVGHLEVGDATRLQAPGHGPAEDRRAGPVLGDGPGAAPGPGARARGPRRTAGSGTCSRTWRAQTSRPRNEPSVGTSRGSIVTRGSSPVARAGSWLGS